MKTELYNYINSDIVWYYFVYSSHQDSSSGCYLYHKSSYFSTILFVFRHVILAARKFE